MKDETVTRQIIPAEPGKYQVVIAYNTGPDHEDEDHVYASRPYDVIAWEFIHSEYIDSSGEETETARVFPVIANVDWFDGVCSLMSNSWCLITKGVDGCESEGDEYKSVGEFIQQQKSFVRSRKEDWLEEQKKSE